MYVKYCVKMEIMPNNHSISRPQKHRHINLQKVRRSAPAVCKTTFCCCIIDSSLRRF